MSLEQHKATVNNSTCLNLFLKYNYQSNVYGTNDYTTTVFFAWQRHVHYHHYHHHHLLFAWVMGSAGECVNTSYTCTSATSIPPRYEKLCI